jgi:TRAP-type C4-dicarboxylate transport system substrate-binding protein
MGLHIVPLPLYDAVAAADDGRVDGFIVVPSAALSFGMFTRARWFTDLHSAFLPGCMVMNAHSFARLSPPDRAAVNAAAARLKQEFESSERRVNQHLEAAFEREGLRASPMSPAFRAAFLESGRAALRRLDSRLAPATLIDETKRILERVR